MTVEELSVEATYNSSTVRFYESFNIPLVYNLPISLFNATDNSSTVMFYKYDL
jgi:hypothetical protein